MAFGDWQCAYAAHGIATFPVEVGAGQKKPLISNYDRIGRRASAALVDKFPKATAIGFMTGKRNRVTVLDIDSADERVLAAALEPWSDTARRRSLSAPDQEITKLGIDTMARGAKFALSRTLISWAVVL
jgi:hypothetical protein